MISPASAYIYVDIIYLVWEGIMENHYHMDLAEFSLGQFRQMLADGYLLPSEKILGEDIAERFATLQDMGMVNLEDLSSALKTKKKLTEFSQTSGLSHDYLTILRRRVGTYTPQPKPLIKLSGIASDVIERLAVLGIKHTRHLFPQVITKSDREALSGKAGVSIVVILELTKLTDLVRAPYVGPVYARIFYEAGFDTLTKLTESQPADLIARIHKVNEELRLTKAILPTSEAEMASFLEIVRMIPQVIEY